VKNNKERFLLVENLTKIENTLSSDFCCIVLSDKLDFSQQDCQELSIKTENVLFSGFCFIVVRLEKLAWIAM